MENRRILSIHFTDGTDMNFEFPIQGDDRSKLGTEILKTMSENNLILDVEGVMYSFPYVNIKYLRVSPCPEKLPRTAILGAQIRD